MILVSYGFLFFLHLLSICIAGKRHLETSRKSRQLSVGGNNWNWLNVAEATAHNARLLTSHTKCLMGWFNNRFDRMLQKATCEKNECHRSARPVMTIETDKTEKMNEKKQAFWIPLKCDRQRNTKTLNCVQIKFIPFESFFPWKKKFWWKQNNRKNTHAHVRRKKYIYFVLWMERSRPWTVHRVAFFSVLSHQFCWYFLLASVVYAKMNYLFGRKREKHTCIGQKKVKKQHEVWIEHRKRTLGTHTQTRTPQILFTSQKSSFANIFLAWSQRRSHYL